MGPLWSATLRVSNLSKEDMGNEGIKHVADGRRVELTDHSAMMS